jgi:hypothetical protein
MLLSHLNFRQLLRCTCYFVALGIYAVLSTGVVYQSVYQRHTPFTLDTLLLASNVFLGGLLLWMCATSRFFHERCFACVTVLCVLGGFVWGCHHHGLRWHREFAQYYGGRFGVELFAFLDKSDLSGERLGVCDYRYYPFFGSRRQRHVCRPLWIPEYVGLLEYLQRHEVTMLIARQRDPLPQNRYVAVKGWLDEHPDVFELLHDDGNYSIVRVDRARLNNALASAKLAQRGP